MQVNGSWTPTIVAFCCNWCSYAGADLSGTNRLSYPANVKIIRIPCSCRLNPMFILRAFQRGADGVILCTPTGSTAYSMSAGGPIVEPSAKNFLITPICAHAMLAKSIVVAPSRVVTVKVGKIGRHNAFLSVDGGRAFRLNTGDEITVKSSQKVTRLVRLKNTSFFEILNRKFIEKMR